MSKNVVDIVIGDWSEDGHNQSEKVSVEINCTVTEMQEAYKASCTKMGFQFHGAEAFGSPNFTGKTNPRCLICEYEDKSVPDDVIDIMEKHGLDDENVSFFREEGSFDGVKHVVKILLWFITQGREGFEAEVVENTIPVFNGYWTDNDMNIGIGYGIY